MPKAINTQEGRTFAEILHFQRFFENRILISFSSLSKMKRRLFVYKTQKNNFLPHFICTNFFPY